MSDPKTVETLDTLREKLEMIYKINGETLSCTDPKPATTHGGAIKFPLPKLLKKLYTMLACNKVTPVIQPSPQPNSSPAPQPAPQPNSSPAPPEITPVERIYQQPFDILILNHIAGFLNTMDKENLLKAYPGINKNEIYVYNINESIQDIVKVAYLFYEITNILYDQCFKNGIKEVYKATCSLVFSNTVYLSIVVANVNDVIEFFCSLIHSKKSPEDFGVMVSRKLADVKKLSELTTFLNILLDGYKENTKDVSYYKVDEITNVNVCVFPIYEQNISGIALSSALTVITSSLISPLINKYNEKMFPAYVANVKQNQSIETVKSPNANPYPQQQSDIIPSVMLKNNAYIPLQYKDFEKLMEQNRKLPMFLLTMIGELVKPTITINGEILSTPISKIQLDKFKETLSNVVQTIATSLNINKDDDLILGMTVENQEFKYTLMKDEEIKPFVTLGFNNNDIIIRTPDNNELVIYNQPQQPGGAIRRKKKYELLTVAELKERCAKRKIKIPKGTKKADIIKLLRKRN
jgi:hypothetical protein